MQQKYKINLYDIQLPKKTTHIFNKKKEYKAFKIAMLSTLVLTVFLSVSQSFGNINSKQSQADFQSLASTTSTSSIVKILK